MVEYISDDETVSCWYVHVLLHVIVIREFSCQPLFRQLIPKSMEAIKRLILADEVSEHVTGLAILVM